MPFIGGAQGDESSLSQLYLHVGHDAHIVFGGMSHGNSTMHKNIQCGSQEVFTQHDS
jgi:hypothetical protein